MSYRFVPTYLGGTSALATTPTVGSPEVARDPIYVPGTEELAEGEIRVSILGSGQPWVTKAQASGSVLMEVGNPERDVFASTSARARWPTSAASRCRSPA